MHQTENSATLQKGCKKEPQKDLHKYIHPKCFTHRYAQTHTHIAPKCIP